ncbi:glycosyltransferase family 2 protein [Cryobacterium sp. TMT1-21]|uniref:Glycosyltransferase family 2 protein n=1 Tax=Cryobacterium shii TaxID=1259235 RepID=A0AAQ2C557_9MICO|nr:MULTISPECIES: glycosyltransferase family 2 protein [Cryobacterium]TFC44942.1 glycosyltransferase family 2 protein [Cryobacterium shii]TFC89621.1 glycosyltransferase family 2 protein [Cryobacterium sp. TmT2-59]TFD11993.1 glycosyltransferase family 2 protein [Cryobacterium sp. TMT4-10]TFD16902.1 glycosyltransferase family 2 protein [Cryobacterium sp. TMT1-21]
MTTLLKHTLIVMPALNEEESVAAVVDEVYSKLPGISVLVVDDGSTDRTAERARLAGATVISLPFNLGVGGAMRVGFKYALAHDFQNVVQVDSDGQHDPSGVAMLVDALDSADVVVGARFAGEGDYSVKGPRRWAMIVLATIISSLAATKLTDTTSGFRATGPRAVRLFAEHYPAEYLGDTIESLVIAARAGCTIRQLPVSMRPRAGGVPSHNPFKAAAYLGRAGMALMIALMRPRVPLATEVTSS